MLHIYDLYDLSQIYILIRAFPDDRMNIQIIDQVLGVLRQHETSHQPNQFRTALSSIDGLDAERYRFAFVQNAYVYFPGMLKDERLYDLLLEINMDLYKVLSDGNKEQIAALADCIHNLPTMLAENHYQVPKYFWEGYVRTYRAAWDKNFLKDWK